MTTTYSSVLTLIWNGIWTGFGVELSFFILWVLWRVAHSRVARRVSSTHWIHVIHEYFD